VAELIPVSPGEMLQEEFLKPLGLTAYRLAKDIGVPLTRIYDIVAGQEGSVALTCSGAEGAALWWRGGFELPQVELQRLRCVAPHATIFE